MHQLQPSGTLSGVSTIWRREYFKSCVWAWKFLPCPLVNLPTCVHRALKGYHASAGLFYSPLTSTIICSKEHFTKHPHRIESASLHMICSPYCVEFPALARIKVLIHCCITVKEKPNCCRNHPKQSQSISSLYTRNSLRSVYYNSCNSTVITLVVY